MPRKVLRAVAITAWTIGACWAWIAIVFGCLLAMIKAREWFGWQPAPKPISEVLIIYGLFGGGTFVATTAALILGMKGKLPGTAKKASGMRGFSVTLPTSHQH
jgi:hypothetical protein